MNERMNDYQPKKKGPPDLWLYLGQLTAYSSHITSCLIIIFCVKAFCNHHAWKVSHVKYARKQYGIEIREYVAIM